MSLKELGEILATDWEGHGDLRLRMARSHRKWGCGDGEVAGWNIRWNDIPKKEQDGFIRRLEAMPM